MPPHKFGIEMSLQEFEKTPDPKNKRYILMKSITDFGMGFIYLAIGVLILFAKKLNFQNEFADSILAKVFAVIVIIYGAWRIYRGWKKDYYRE